VRWCTNGEPVPSTEFCSHSTYACGLRAAAGKTEVNCWHNDDVGLATDRVDFAVFDPRKARAEGRAEMMIVGSLSKFNFFSLESCRRNLSFFSRCRTLSRAAMANELVLCFVPDPEQCLGPRTVTRRKYQLTHDNGACRTN